MTTKPLWIAFEIIDAIMPSRAYNLDLNIEISGISIDSRTTKVGDVFFAIKGDRFDGHDFVEAAIAKGASLCVVNDKFHRASENKKLSLIVVDDVLSALNQLAIASRSRMRGKVIAVTGSAGKTTTKELMRMAFIANNKKTHAAIASYNNHWGVPYTLASMPRDCEVGIFEIGMNNKTEIAPLAKMVKPNLAVVTNIAPVHMAGFSSIEEIAIEKASIFEGLTGEKKAIINGDTNHYKILEEMAKKYKASEIISFGETDKNNSHLISYQVREGVSSINAMIDGNEIIYKLSLLGKHHAINSLAVLSLINSTGDDIALSALEMGNLEPLKGRGLSIEYSIGNSYFTLIDESYNANPLSMAAAINNLSYQQATSRGRKIAVIGDMLELGDEACRFHENLAEIILKNGVDMLFTCGDNMSYLAQKLSNTMLVVHKKNSSELVNPVLSAIMEGDLLMVKGSLASDMAVIIEAVEGRYKHFSKAR